MAVSTHDDRPQRALELRLAGAPYDRIADAVGYSNKGTAYRAVQRALGEMQRQTTVATTESTGDTTPADENRDMIDLEMARLDAMRTGLWSKARRGDVQAVDWVIRIGERQMELRELLRRQAPPVAPAATSLSDFEKRLRQRERNLGSNPAPGSSG